MVRLVGCQGSLIIDPTLVCLQAYQLRAQGVMNYCAVGYNSCYDLIQDGFEYYCMKDLLTKNRTISH